MTFCNKSPLSMSDHPDPILLPPRKPGGPKPPGQPE